MKPTRGRYSAISAPGQFVPLLSFRHWRRRGTHLAKYNMYLAEAVPGNVKLFPGTKRKHPTFVGCFLFGIRQRPTLPGRLQPSTIGAERLNFCVRYGNRWDPFAIVTGILSDTFRTLKTAHPDFLSCIRPVFQFSLWSHLILRSF